MKTRVTAGVRLLFLAFVQTSASAGEGSSCDIVLTTKAFNTSDYAASTSISLQTLDDACNKEYTSQSAAQSAAKAAGASVGWGGFSFGASEAKSEGSTSWSIRDSQLCTSRRQQLASSSETTVRRQDVDSAVRAWEACIRATQSDKLFIKYDLMRDGTGLAGTIIRNPVGGAFGSFLGLSTVPFDSDEKLVCKIDGVQYESNQKPVNPVPWNRTDTSIVCKKKKDASFKFTIDTTTGSPPFIDLPSVQEQRNIDIQQVMDAVAAVRQRVDLLEVEMKKKVPLGSAVAFKSHTGAYIGVTGGSSADDKAVNIGRVGAGGERAKNAGAKNAHERFIIESHDE